MSIWLWAHDNQFLIGLVLSVAAIVLTLWIAVLQKKKTFLVFKRSDFALIGGAAAAFPDKVKILFGDREVHRLTSSRFIVWNGGNTPIISQNFAAKDPLRIELLGSVSVLQHDILRASREVNGVATKIGQNSIEIEIDFLDPKEGFCVEVLHDGDFSSASIHGTLIGNKKGILQVSAGSRLGKFVLGTFTESIFAVLGLLALLGGLIYNWSQIEHLPQDQRPQVYLAISVAGFVLMLSFAILGVAFSISMARSYDKTIDPGLT